MTALDDLKRHAQEFHDFSVPSRGRPAEATAGTAAIGSLLAVILGANSPEAMATMVAAIGLVPGLVTWLVNAGGVRGALRKLWRGRD